MTALPPLKTTSYYTDTPDSLALSKRGSIWSIGVETADGMIEFELSTAAACAVRQFFADAVCAECKPAPEPQPAPEPEPVVDLGTAERARTAAAVRLRDWIQEQKAGLIGCTPAMVSQVAVDAAAPLIAAQALLDASDALVMGHKPDGVSTWQWLRDRAEGHR